MFLGIDVGTTATKAILIDSDQRTVASATAHYEVSELAPGVSEFDAPAWLEAVRSAVGDLRRGASRELAATRAIGLSGQMHSLVTLDAGCRPVRRVLLWDDGRAQEECLELRRAIPDIGPITGVLPTPSFTASKLLWLKKAHRDEFDRIAHVLWPKDYVRHWLTGEFVTDTSDAAGSQLLDQRERTWADRVVDYLELDRRCLPRLLEGPDVSGVLLPDIARELGLPPGIPVAAGGGDAATSALGLGCIRGGRGLISLGTGAVFLATQESYRPSPETLVHTFAHCIPGRWYRMAAMLNGASCLSWVARICNTPDLEDLLSRVEARGEGPGRVLFQPYLRGERTPYNDVSARGAFVGLDAACDGVDLARAVLEGVAYSLRLAQDVVGPPSEPLSFVGIVGGGARSPLWTRIIATVLGRPLAIIRDADFVAALGAARLAMIASGAVTLADANCKPFVLRNIDPDERQMAAHAERFSVFRELYPALRGLGQSHRVVGS
jgi:xylulokinase